MELMKEYLQEKFDCDEHIKASCFKDKVDQDQGLLNFFINTNVESAKRSINKNFDKRMELNERICFETERLVNDIKTKEEELKEKEKKIEREVKLYKAQIAREYEKLMEQFRQNVDKKIKPVEKRIDKLETAKSKTDAARLTSLSNS